MWHRFRPSSDDDQTCTQPSCGLIVTDDCAELVETDCPATACPDESNTDGVCVVVPGPTGPECAYCAGRFTLEELDDDPDAPLPIL